MGNTKYRAVFRCYVLYMAQCLMYHYKDVCVGVVSTFHASFRSLFIDGMCVQRAEWLGSYGYLSQ